MATTFTAYDADEAIIENNAGAGVPNVKYIRYDSGATTINPASDTVKMFRVPNKHWITGAYLQTSTSATTFTVTLGVTGDADKFNTSVVDGAVLLPINLPYKVDLSDTADPQYVDVLVGPNAGSAVPSVSIDMVVTYVRDEQDS